MSPTKIISATLLAAVTILACTGSKKTAYNFPVEMRPDIQAQFTVQAEKGRILYEMNCGGCHNKMVGGKSIVPDFTQEQLVGYEIRTGNADHESSLREERVSAEELGLIMTYLTYKKRSGVPQERDTTGRH